MTTILVYTVIGLIGNIIYWTAIGKLMAKNKKTTKKIELAKILKKIPDLIIEAEKQIGQGNGFAKLNYVLNKLHIECIEKGLNYDELGFEYEVEKVLNTPQKKGEKESETTENA